MLHGLKTFGIRSPPILRLAVLLALAALNWNWNWNTALLLTALCLSAVPLPLQNPRDPTLLLELIHGSYGTFVL
jgi:hypothetical protein